jgi:hypothetical protein
MPHSEFLSWPDDDQDKALAFQAQRHQVCPGCGTRPEEWIGGDGRRVDEDPYTAEAIKCYGCVARGALADELRPRENEPPEPGIRVVLRRRRKRGEPWR